MADHPPLLHHYVDCRRRGTPSSGKAALAALRTEIDAQRLELIDETVTDGNCGVHVFALGLLEAGRHLPPLYRTTQFKKLLTTRRDTNAMIHHLRHVACQWYDNNADTEVCYVWSVWTDLR